MKKLILTFLLLCTGLFLFSQNVTTTISGTIINTSTGLPVDNQAVYIAADSSSFNYNNVVYTNPNGYYVDTLTIPHPSQIIFYISTSDCNGSWITNTVVSSTLPMVSCFTISCGGNPSTCSADFSAYPDSANIGFAYYFYDQSVGGPGTITTWYWNFGDGATSTLQYPIHTYANIGWYNVCLHIATDSGCTSTFCDSIYVDTTNTGPCQASFGYQSVNNTFDFYGYSNVSPAYFMWDFGDGSSGTGQYVSHYYTNPGTYTVCLTIHNNNGCYNQYCETIVVSGSQGNGCPASYYVHQDSLNSGSFTYYFINTSPGANSGMINFYWYFSDGTTSSDINPVHTFANAGLYSVCLHVLDDSTGNILCTYCDSILVDTSNTIGCYASFGWNASNTGDVYFTDYSGAGNVLDYIISWTWCFGDGSSSTDQNPIHNYAFDGLYNVCLTINTSLGCSSTYCDYIQISNDSTNYNCGLYVTANTIVYESAPGASDGLIDIDVYGGIPPYTFSWSNGATTEDISGLTAGYYDVLVTDNSGTGCHTWASFEILNQADSSNWIYIDTLFTNSIDSCFNFSIGSAYIYSWTFIDNTTIEIVWIVYDTQGVNIGFVTTVYTFSSIGNYQFSVTIICGQLKSTHVFYDDLYIMDGMAGLTDNSASTEVFNIYPNPVTDVANIALNNFSGNATVSVSNATGQLVYQTVVAADVNQGMFAINTSSLPNGLYFIQVVCNGQALTGRFIK